MSHLVVILGATGSGKSTSIKNLNPQETVILALKALDKDLPFKGSRKLYNKESKNYFALKDYNEILTYMESISNNATGVHNIVLEDATYIMRTEFFDRSAERGFDKYNELADHFRRIIAKGSFQPSLKRFAKTPTTRVVIPLMATLKAAIVPTSIFFGIEAVAAAACVLSAGTLALFTVSVSLEFTALSLSAAAFAIFS